MNRSCPAVYLNPWQAPEMFPCALDVLACVSTWSVISLMLVKFVVVPQQTHQQLCQCTESAASRCACSSGWPFLRWLCVDDTCLDSYPPHHPRDAKGSNRLQTQERNSQYHSRQITEACPGLRSLSSSASSGVEVIVSDSWLVL